MKKEEKLTQFSADFIERKSFCSGSSGSESVSDTASPVADEPFGHESPFNTIVEVIRTGPPSPDYSRPWQREEDHSYDSSGFIVRGRRVLTCAHSVDRHTVVELKKLNSDRLYPATVLAVAPECDIAMLTVCDEEFWEGLKPVTFGSTPVAPGDEVIIMGYQSESGDPSEEIESKIKSQVLNVDMITYLHWGIKLLAFQVDVGIKKETFGGAVFNLRGKCVGMTFQSTDLIADVIPSEVIEHFIQDHAKNGAYTGIPILAVTWQNMVSPSLRKSMKMRQDQQGVLITEVKPNYPESEILKLYDIILNIDGIDIGNDGTVPFTRGRRIEFSYLLTQKYKNDKVVLKVVRNSEIHEFSINLATHKQFKQANSSGRPLPYYICAGFVFTTLSFPHLKSLCGRFYEHIREELLSQALYEERVVVCKVLEADINTGYDEEGIVHSQVHKFNGKPVRDLKSLASMVEQCREKFLEFTLDNSERLVVETENARAATPDILKKYSIPFAMSDDLKIHKQLNQEIDLKPMDGARWPA